MCLVGYSTVFRALVSALGLAVQESRFSTIVRRIIIRAIRWPIVAGGSTGQSPHAIEAP